jgi:hypothetical protein
MQWNAFLIRVGGFDKHHRDSIWIPIRIALFLNAPMIAFDIVALYFKMAGE